MANPICTVVPVGVTLRVIGGKWKPLILWHVHEGTVRFGELMRKMPGITQKMLTQQLRELENDKLVTRTVYAEVPPRVEYILSEYGNTLWPVLNAMAEWGRTHVEIQEKAHNATAIYTHMQMYQLIQRNMK